MSVQDRLVEQAIRRYELSQRLDGARGAPAPPRPGAPPGARLVRGARPAVRRVAVLGRLPL